MSYELRELQAKARSKRNKPEPRETGPLAPWDRDGVRPPKPKKEPPKKGYTIQVQLTVWTNDRPNTAAVGTYTIKREEDLEVAVRHHVRYGEMIAKLGVPGAEELRKLARTLRRARR